MSWGRCPTCAEYTELDRHTCPPAWHCYDPETSDESDASLFYAHDAEDAAEAAGETWGQEDGFQAEQTILVRAVGSDGPWRKFLVTGEIVPQFNAKEIT